MAHVATDDRFARLIDEYEPVRQLGTGFTFTEGPLWHPRDGALIFSDMPADVRRRYTPGQGVAEIQKPSMMGNGMTYDADLNLLVCEHATSAVARIGPQGGRELLASHFEGRELNSPNDIVVRRDGAVFFTDPTFGRMAHFGVPRPTQMGFQGVYMLPPGHVPGAEAVLVSDRYMFSQPNGLCFSPCERWMWVNDTEQANIRMFDVGPDGMLRNGRIFASGIKESGRPGVPDGMKADRDGNLYVTAPGGIWVYDFHGLKLGEIRVPELVANFHWGDPDWGTLYICATSSLYSVRTRTQGRSEAFMTPRAQSAQRTAPARAAAPSASASASASDKGLTLADRIERIDPARTAMILQDLQNDVIIDGGAFAASGSPNHARAQNVVANVARLAQLARARGIMVLHAWMVCEPGHPFLSRNAPLLRGLKDENALVRGTWGVAPAAGLEPQTGDLVVEKMSMSVWETSRLESYLRHGGRDTILNCGAWTNMSVEHTARTAADKGFRVIVAEDACSTMNADWHRASINYAMQNVADVTTTEAVAAALSG
ncbi:isochorismatase family protein [Roseisalinus antarcticus]|uniref:Gluconolactonase n=1 Tax=Roseisalinus antarcticus TaxID=254357 RepID=A0A1Y5TI72_9RHOB|nr:isochorismatase family protein [Roseisalinus antarcticus]SLN64254.1 Gluconolactonase precursor [Roseisalinus antarcticus]